MKPDQAEIFRPTYPSPDAHRGAEAMKRIQRMVEVARRMMRERGYYQMSIDAILKEAGGSKATFRKYFVNKAGILRVVLRDEAADCVAEADAAAQDQPTAATGLRAFSLVVLRFLCRPDALAVNRAATGEVKRNPQVARWFYLGGYGTFVAALTAHLQAWQERGILEASMDAEADADRFLFMLRSGPHDRALLGIVDQVTGAEIESHVDACVDLFLHGRAAGSSNAGK